MKYKAMSIITEAKLEVTQKVTGCCIHKSSYKKNVRKYP